MCIASLVLLGAANPTLAQPSEDRAALTFDAGPPSDSGAPSKADAGPPIDVPAPKTDTGKSRPSPELWEPVFDSRSSTTVGPPPAEERLRPPEVARRADTGFGSVTTLDLESGFNPFHEAAPLAFGAGFGWRALTTPADTIGPSARLGVLAMTLVDAIDEQTQQRARTALWGAVPFFADLDVYGRLGQPFVSA